MFDKLAPLYAEKGIQLSSMTPDSSKSDIMTTSVHDGVPYCFMNRNEFAGNLDVTKIERNARHFHLTIARHHDKVKAIYNHLMAQNVGEVWCMCGGGAQLQIFFGNKTGYLGILYLDLEDLKEQKRLEKSGYLAACGNASFTLKSNWDHNAVYFKGMKVPGVKFSR